MWLRRCFAHEFNLTFSHECQYMKLSEISRTISHMRINRAAPEAIAATVTTAIREFRTMDRRIRSKDGMNSVFYLLNEVRLMDRYNTAMLDQLIPAIYMSNPDMKVLTFAYFMLRRAGCKSEEFFLWAEERLLEETAHVSGMMLKDLLHLLAGFSCVEGPLSHLQKRILSQIDSLLCAQPHHLDDINTYSSALHAFGKAGSFSKQLQHQLLLRLEKVITQSSQFYDKYVLGVVCSSACRLGLSQEQVKTLIYPVILRHLPKISLKHLLNILFYTTELTYFDRDFYEKAISVLPEILPNKHMTEMMSEVKQRVQRFNS